MLLSDVDIQSLPEPEVTHIQTSHLFRYQQNQKQKQDFWKVWSSDYLVLMQQRSKWRTRAADIKPNQLVFILDDHTLPSKWSLGRISETHAGTNGIFRVVTIYQRVQTLLHGSCLGPEMKSFEEICLVMRRQFSSVQEPRETVKDWISRLRCLTLNWENAFLQNVLRKLIRVHSQQAGLPFLQDRNIYISP